MRVLYKDAIYLSSVIVLAFSFSFFLSALLSLKYTLKFNDFMITSKEVRESKRTIPFKVHVSRSGFFKSKSSKEVKETSVSQYKLSDLKLKGTIVCGECGRGIAIVENENKKVKALKPGDVVNGYKLKSVHPKYIILERDNDVYKLALYERKNIKEDRSGVDLKKTESSISFKVKRNKVIKEISSGKFLRYINIVPHIENGQTKGMFVRYVNRRSFIHKLGIRPGDIILSINGVEINSPEDSFSAFEQLKNEDTVIITVLRRGKRLDLKYELE